jgi:hypothetical protein
MFCVEKLKSSEDELFRLAPIRHLVLICVPEVVD